MLSLVYNANTYLLVLIKNGVSARFRSIIPFIKYLKIISSVKKRKPKATPPTGLEPAIFGLGGRRVIHYATEASIDNTQYLKCNSLVIYSALEILQVSVSILN